jgi:hypothetical protein
MPVPADLIVQAGRVMICNQWQWGWLAVAQGEKGMEHLAFGEAPFAPVKDYV